MHASETDDHEVGIVSAGSALPGPLIGNSALAHRFGMDTTWEQWIDTFIGTQSRHLALDLDSGKPFTSLAELAARAGTSALERAGLAASDIDVLVLATATPDALIPTTATMVAEHLGINEIPTYQLQSGCTGAYQALELGAQLLRVPGRRNALVLGGDVLVKHFDVDVDVRSLSPGELVNLLLFGDGAGAAVLTAEPREGMALLREIRTRLTGLGREPGQTVEWFGLADRQDARSAAREDYKAIETFVPTMAVEMANELLRLTGWSVPEVDYLLPPQLSGLMTDLIVERLGFPGAEEVSCVRESANTGNAVPFQQLERLLPELVTGDRALGVAIESSKWIKAGFALERS